MAQISQKALPEIKDNIEDSFKYFDANIKRFQDFMYFVFETSLSNEQVAALAKIGRPPVEFNILEAYVSARRAEFAKHQPEIVVRAADGVPIEYFTQNYSDTIELLEAYFRAIFDNGNHNLEYNVYTDLLAGGWSVIRVYTDYISPYSFDQNIYIDKVDDPCMTFFDPLAKEKHKGDGRYCGEIYPLTRKQFEEKFGKQKAEQLSYTRSIDGFNWSYQNNREDIALVADYYCKKKKKETLVKLTNGADILLREYEAIKKFWEENNFIEQLPQIRNKRRTDVEVIVRYRLCENQILDYIETNYEHLPLVFIDGNSMMITRDSERKQLTRPYVYHALGIQKLKNVSGQALAFELETTIQHKFIAAEEAIPDNPEYLEAYLNVQESATMIYRHYDPDNPDKTLPAPTPVQRAAIPPEITNTFTITDQMTQAILGSYDNAMGAQRADLSGIALARTAILSNNSAVPYQMGYIQGINRVLEIVLNLIPKYYITPRTVPVVLPDGKRDYARINDKHGLQIRYDSNAFNVNVSVGVNYAVQKEISLQTITGLMQASSGFADFINRYGINVILDNVDIRGIEALKQKYSEYQQELKQQQQIAMQQQAAQAQAQQQLAQKELSEPSQAQLSMMALQQQAQRDNQKSQIEAAKVNIDQEETNIKFLEALAKIRSMNVEAQERAAQISQEQARTAVELINDQVKLGEMPGEEG